MRENGTLTWLISDHLGSTSLTVDASGALLSSLKYTAFGELRSGTAAIDYLYTGQRQEAEIGLYFYVSRFFDPSLGRFISPDTIVPGAGNPQAYDRYAYVFNNPIRYTDPTGHIACIDGEQCGSKITAAAVLIRFGIKLDGNFSTQQKNAIMTGVVDVGIRLGATVKDTSINAYKAAYNITSNKEQVFLKGTKGASGECANITAGGCTSSQYLINFMTFSQNAANNVVHELGHAFDNASGRAASNQLSFDKSINPDLQRKGIPGKYFGFGSTYKSGPLEWQMSVNPVDSPNYVETGSEVFADMFLGFTYNTWYQGANRVDTKMANAKSSWMGSFMSGWFREME